MVKIEINPSRIERVMIEAKSQLEADFDLPTFMLIQPFLAQINEALQRQLEQAGFGRETAGLR
jgi:hypothetical protein